jgi:orotate phosphoribosyltransferase
VFQDGAQQFIGGRLGAVVPAMIATIDRQEGARENVENAGVRFEALFTKKDLGIAE